MATYNSEQIRLRKAVPGFGAGGGQLRRAEGVVTVPAGATTADLFPMFYLPANAKVVSGGIKTDDLDTGTTVTINVGDTGNGINAASANRYFAAVSGQAAANLTTMALTGVNFKVGAAPMLVQMQLQAGPTTTAGSVEVHLNFTVEEPQTV